MDHDDVIRRIKELFQSIGNGVSGRDFTAWFFTKHPFAKTEHSGQYMFSWKCVSAGNDMVIGPKDGFMHDPLDTYDKIMLVAMRLGHFKDPAYFCPHVEQIGRLIRSSFRLKQDDLIEMDWPEIMRYVRDYAHAHGITDDNVYLTAVKTACKDLPQELNKLSAEILLNGVKGVQFDRLKGEVYYPILSTMLFGVRLFRGHPDGTLSALIASVVDTFDYIEKIQEVPRSSALRRIAEFCLTVEKCLSGGAGRQDGNAGQKRNIWDGISPEMKTNIEDYWAYAKKRHDDGRRPNISEFCGKEGIVDEAMFKCQLDTIRKRRKSGWAEQ